jgi:hypothetical protein
MPLPVVCQDGKTSLLMANEYSVDLIEHQIVVIEKLAIR